MQFKVSSKELEKLLSKIIPAVPNRTPMQILENFHFVIKDGLLTASATDIEISLRSSINVDADENADFIISARLLYDIIRTLGDTQISFALTDGNKINMKTDNGNYNISYLPSNDFPAIPEVSKDRVVTLSGADLRKAISQTSFAMSKEDMRPAMTGTLVEFSEEGIRFVATDGHRLVKFINKKFKSKEEDQYIIPERAVTVLSKLLTDSEVNINLSKSHISFQIDTLQFISRLIGEKYPAYQSVIPVENENSLKVNHNEILASIRRMLLFSTGNSKQVKFSITENKLEISSEDIDKGSNAKEIISCEYKGEPMDIGFNTIYINEVLSNFHEEDVIFKLHSPNKACVLVPVENKENEDLMMLLMPVRLNY